MEQDVGEGRYFTDREYGERSRTLEVVDERIWGGLCALIETGVDDGSFGHRFPEMCLDGLGPCGCDERRLARVLGAELRGVEWPLSDEDLPETPVILDLLEFCARAVGEPIQGNYHEFMGHYHLSWDRETGLARFVEDVNVVLKRNGVAFMLTEDGRAQRVLPDELAVPLGRAVFDTGDGETDRLLELARSRITSPKAEDRQDALEKLWDAFERIKTLEPGTDKRARAEALLDRAAAPGSGFRRLLDEEVRALTTIGNSFRIRHSETTQEPVGDLERVDYLFGRLYAFVRLMLKATSRGG